MDNFRYYFGFQKEPFSADIKTDDLYLLPRLNGLAERFLYAVEISGIVVITGDVGTGKSTSLRYAAAKLHPSGYKIISVIANSGTMIEMLRQLAIGFKMECSGNSVTKLSQIIREAILEVTLRKEKLVLIIDESHLLRLDVFAQLHILTQFEFDSKPTLPIILSGQNNLIDKLAYCSSRSLASRVIGRSHLEGLSFNDMKNYLAHHLQIAGVSVKLFSDESMLAIHQGSGGLLRKANNLAKGALMAAAKEKSQVVAAEHVRVASTELF
jgi:general secretion pathway protein A